MDGVDRLIFELNMVGALFACAVNLWAAISPGPFTMWRPLRAVTALLAGVYATGYALVLAGALPVAQWSEFFRGVSLMVWPIVWAGPAGYSAWAWHTAKRGARVIVEQTADAR